MTTAHRPTWNAAVGGKDQSGNRSIAPTKAYSSRDLPGHTTLKTRRVGQNAPEEIEQRDLLRELEAREFEGASRKRKRDEMEEDEEGQDRAARRPPRAFLGAPEEVDEAGGARASKYRKVQFDFSRDADDADSDSSDDDDEQENGERASDSDDSDSDSDSDDDEADLLRELEKIKEERRIEEQKRALEEAEQEDRAREAAVMGSNPLMSGGATSAEDYSLRKKWYDDVVFKNQSRSEKKVEKRFINDTIRNDFHRKFLQKYVK
eukprot:TRINITY_DN14100_c0_g1_i1.p1 TRINITY_DN14100_c0_g1~~TRINITY_DN14100_c0_g1_i1.p1  ORF type:complete len:279 (+),score=87.52 TRINITY_DN14100_c0_g1_i1:49-837(+)